MKQTILYILYRHFSRFSCDIENKKLNLNQKALPASSDCDKARQRYLDVWRKFIWIAKTCISCCLFNILHRPCQIWFYIFGIADKKRKFKFCLFCSISYTFVAITFSKVTRNHSFVGLIQNLRSIAVTLKQNDACCRFTSQELPTVTPHLGLLRGAPQPAQIP